MKFPLSISKMCFEKIKEKSKNSKAITVTILCATDCDALASLNILTHILEKQNIKFKLCGVSNLVTFKAKMKELNENPGTRSIITLNVGGMQDLTQYDFYNAKNGPKIYAYVFDSHRPIHHANISADDRIVVIDDGETNIKDCPSKEEIQMQMEFNRRKMIGDVEGIMELLRDCSKSVASSTRKHVRQLQEHTTITPQQETPLSCEEIEEIKERKYLVKKNQNSEPNSLGKGAEFGKKRFLVKKNEQSSMDEGEDLGFQIEGDEEKSFQLEDQYGDSTVRKNPNPTEQSFTETISNSGFDDIQAKVIKYYQGTFYANPTSGIIYQILRQMKLQTKQAVWDWCVGLSDQLIHMKMDQDQYNSNIEKVIDECERLDRKYQGENAIHNIPETETEAKSSLKKRPSIGEIIPTVIAKCSLLQFSTLRESVTQSPYFYSSMQLYRKQGQQNFGDFLIKLGISIQDSNQKYEYLEGKMKNNLTDSLQERDIRYTLFDNQRYGPTLNTLTKYYKKNFSLSAHDYALTLACTLQNPQQLMGEYQSLKAKQWGFEQDTRSSSTLVNAEDDKQREMYKKHLQRVNEIVQKYDSLNFVKAYQLLSSTDNEYLCNQLHRAIESSKVFNRRVSGVASYFLQKKGNVFNLKNYSEASLHAGKSNGDGYVHRPLAMMRLSSFLHQVQCKRRAKPGNKFVLIVQDPWKLNLQILGTKSNDFKKNNWSQVFNQIVGGSGREQGELDIVRNHLDAHILEVASHDQLPFVVELQKLDVGI